MNNLQFFETLPFIQALKLFFEDLKVPVSYFDDKPVSAKVILDNFYKDNKVFQTITDVYVLGLVNDAAFEEESSALKNQEAVKQLNEDYDGLLIIGVVLKDASPTRSALSELTRAFNRSFPHLPVTVIFHYGSFISIANTERLAYIQQWREGEKIGKVTLLKDINTIKPHAAHLRILASLAIDPVITNTFKRLYQYWQSVFSLQALNNEFYGDLQKWFHYASQHVKLPFKPDYISKEENIKNFLVRLLSRTMFCWFVKEKGLIKPELLELKDWEGNYYPITDDVADKKFLQSNSYYRGILQNVFFNALNKKEKKGKKDFEWKEYLHPNFKFEWLTHIPYLNGGIFDRLDEDNAKSKQSTGDDVLKVPNFLFYGKEEKTKVTRGGGARAVEVVETIEHKGLNGILKSYKFTLEENTPYEEDIALDPELLGLVFENLLAELDPNLEESTIKSIRKLTGSYYTPRQVIQEMINESLFIYLKKHIDGKDIGKLKDLVYQNLLTEQDAKFNAAVVKAIDQYKVLDPACGSGAFPMGMLHRLVEILRKTDHDNSLWLKLKLQPLEAGFRLEFEKTLKQHLDDYSRKLGIIRDSIYGIDIQPLAVQITKLRFFISLLIDQKVEKGITPMPNIETKIICANSLKDIKVDMHSMAAIDRLIDVRTKYYQSDISSKERQDLADEIVDVLDVAFPSFSFQVTGKKVPGQNKELIRHWFTHATIAAPFFNMDFFYPELKEKGFDCVIGNPPYGGTKITDEVRTALDIDSKDPYGAFIARFLASGSKQTPLKHGGVLAFIVSDTFMTIKSHFKLRKQMMDNYIYKMIRVNPDTFRATVNTAIIICERNLFPVKGILPVFTFDESHVCQMVDMTNISILEDHSRFAELLRKTEGVDFNVESGIPKSTSNKQYAIYYYPQNLIRTNSNLPFFVAPERLFKLQSDVSPIISRKRNINHFFSISMNSKILELYRTGENYSGSGKNKIWQSDGLFKIVSGIKTGNNSKYLRSRHEVQVYLNDEEAVLLKDEAKLNGIKGNKAFVSFEMGQGSDSEQGLLPCYYQQPSDILIDWSKRGVEGMKNEAHSDLANKEFRFIPLKNQISFSCTGQYAPTFRTSSGIIFLNKASRIFLSEEQDQLEWLAHLNSKLFKFFNKCFSNHTVEFGVEDLKSIIVINYISGLSNKTKFILKKQMRNEKYDYASHEQLEIDKLVYDAYGLNAEDVQEVENWYARRYPKLSEAQKTNLRRLGKSDDYLVLYGLKEATEV